MKREIDENPLKGLSLAIGAGVLSGLAGTIAITISQLIEMRLTNRKASSTPIEAVSKVLDVKPTHTDTKEKVSQEIHWVYGTVWGIPRGIMAMVGVTGWPATVLHFTAITGTAMTLLPKLKVVPPITEQSPKAIAIDALHHAVYTVVAGLTYDLIDED